MHYAHTHAHVHVHAQVRALTLTLTRCEPSALMDHAAYLCYKLRVANWTLVQVCKCVCMCMGMCMCVSMGMCMADWTLVDR